MTKTEKMKALIINDEPLINIGVQNILEQNIKDVKVTISFEQEDILDISRQEDFDIILLDVGITALDTKGLMQAFKTHQKQAHILILSRSEYKHYAMKYISWGASGFIDKSSSGKDLMMAINLAQSGQLYLSKDMINSIYNDHMIGELNGSPIGKLSKRELEVFKLLIKGKRIKDVSEALEIHQSSASTLKKRIFEKFKVDNMMKLKTMAMEYGY